MAHPLTLLITCRNERANIGPCIDSVREIADEVLVADSGSTDGTLEYVRARGDCRIIERKYVTAGDFRNWAIPQARHSWILVLDADERATPELVAEIRAVLAGAPRHDGYFIRRINHLMGHRGEAHRLGTRLGACGSFAARRATTTGPATTARCRCRTGNIGRLRHAMNHYTIWTWEQYLKKFDRYTRVQACAMAGGGPPSELLPHGRAAAAAIPARLRAAPGLPRRRRGSATGVDVRVLHVHEASQAVGGGVRPRAIRHRGGSHGGRRAVHHPRGVTVGFL